MRQEQVDWEHWDASGNTLKYTTSAANPVSSAAELEVIGNDVGQVRPFSYNPVDKTSPLDKIKAFALVDVGGCVQDGIATDCANISGGAVAQCPNNDCGPQVFTNSHGQTVLSSPFQAYADGTSGYNVPIWGNLGVRVVENGDNSSAPLDPRNDTIIGTEFRQVSSSGSWRLNFQDNWLDNIKKYFDSIKNKTRGIMGGDAKHPCSSITPLQLNYDVAVHPAEETGSDHILRLHIGTGRHSDAKRSAIKSFLDSSSKCNS